MNKDRRKFLKIVLIGTASFFSGKILGPVFSSFFEDSSKEINSKPKSDKKNFHIVENKQILSIYDNAGEEVFQIDNNA